MSDAALVRPLDRSARWSRPDRSRRRLAATALSLLFHAGFGWLVVVTLQSPPGTAESGETGGGTGAIDVTLVGARLASPAPGNPGQDLETMLNRFRAASPDAVPMADKAKPSGDLGELSNAMDREQASDTKPTKQGRPSNGQALMSQIGRCWTPPKSGRDVGVVVQLNAGGEVVAPPNAYPIVDASGGAAELAEAERAANRAVWACAPYRLPAGGGASFYVEFRARPAQP